MFQSSVKHISQVLIFGGDCVVSRQRICQRMKMYSAEFRLIYSVLAMSHTDRFRGLTFSWIIVGVDLSLVEYA